MLSAPPRPHRGEQTTERERERERDNCRNPAEEGKVFLLLFSSLGEKEKDIEEDVIAVLSSNQAGEETGKRKKEKSWGELGGGRYGNAPPLSFLCLVQSCQFRRFRLADPVPREEEGGPS